LQCSTSSSDSKGGPGWAMAPQIFAWSSVWPPLFFFLLISRLSSFG